MKRSQQVSGVGCQASGMSATRTPSLQRRIPIFILLALLAASCFLLPTCGGTQQVSLAPIAPIWYDDLETGQFSKWYWQQGSPAINSNPSFVHRGNYSLRCHYSLLRPPQEASTDAYTSQRIDGTTGYGQAGGYPQVFQRAYVYFKHPESGATVDDIRRKTFWISARAAWAVILLIDSSTSPTGRLDIGINYNPPAGATAPSVYHLAQIDYDTWYYMELEVKVNTPGVADGVWGLWYAPDGGTVTQIFYSDNVNFRGDRTENVDAFRFGDQVEYVGSPCAVNEYRYFDDMVVSTAYIGPVIRMEDEIN